MAPTGVQIIDCDQCGLAHPMHWSHCPVCGQATMFEHDFCFPDTAA